MPPLTYKLKDLEADLNDLQLAYSNPRIYMANYFENLRNEIDIELEQYLRENNYSMATGEIGQVHLSMINAIDRFEKTSFRHLFKNELDEDLSKLVANVLNNIGDTFLAAHAESNEESFCNQFHETILSTLFLIQERLFLNKSIIFLKTDHLNKLHGDSKKYWMRLLTVSDVFVSQRLLDLQIRFVLN